jgi:hypothetical protein
MPVGKRKLSQTSDAVRFREKTRAFREAGLCRCGRTLDNQDKSRCLSCLESDRAIHRRIRELVLFHYGGKCSCCSIDIYEFLAMDHKEGNGNQHRQKVTGHKKALPYRWYIQNNFPPEFEILCHNCNMAKGLYGVCPHQSGRGN